MKAFKENFETIVGTERINEVKNEVNEVSNRNCKNGNILVECAVSRLCNPVIDGGDVRTHHSRVRAVYVPARCL